MSPGELRELRAEAPTGADDGVNPLGGDAAAPGAVTVTDQADAHQAKSQLTVRQEVAGTVAFMVAVGDMKFPGIRALYESKPEGATATHAEQLTDAIADVCRKYGVTMPGFLEQWRPEITLLMVALPLAKATLDVMAAAKAKRTAAGDAPAAGDASSVTPASSVTQDAAGTGLTPLRPNE